MASYADGNTLCTVADNIDKDIELQYKTLVSVKGERKKFSKTLSQSFSTYRRVKSAVFIKLRNNYFFT